MFNFLFNHTPLLYLTQSLWRDEAYSVLLSQHSVLQIIKLTAQDFNPPLYYLILHFWMILFGNSEISVRLLSFVFHLLLVYVFYKFIKKVFKSSSFNFQLLASSFVFLNPMLLYYGFEARMYSLLALLATASMYFFYCKKWKSYILVSALGLWTQPFMVFVLLSQVVYWLMTKGWKYSSSEARSSNRSSQPSASNNKQSFSANNDFFVSLFFIFLLFSPWFPTLVSQFRHSSSSWIWPINATTVTSILGNLFTGYEGTPGELWGLMGIISLAIILLAFYVLRHLSRHAEFSSASVQILKQVQDDKIFIKLLLCWLFIPVILVLTISFFKPIYVNRYLIFVSVAEVFLIIAATSLIKNSSIRFMLNALSVGMLCIYLMLNVSLLFTTVSFHQKQNIRQTMNEINYLAKPTDMILAQTPLIIFETKYYSRDGDQVFLYNPERRTIPDYVGKNLINEMKQAVSFPIYPKRAFLIHEDASYEMVYQR